MKKNTKFTRCFYTLSAVLVSLLFITGVPVAADTQEWDKTFPKSDKVIHEKVSYPNRYGITVAADMYLPKNINKSKKYAALIVGTPYGGVKEHPRSHGPFTKTSEMAFMNFPLMNYIESISPRPILFIMGENAHSRYFTEDAYKRAAEPKELCIVPGARHIDLYDRTDMIPFDKLESFFRENLGT